MQISSLWFSLLLSAALAAALAGGCHLIGGTGDYAFTSGSAAASGGSGGGASCDPAMCPGLDAECRSRSCLPDGSCGFSNAARGAPCEGDRLCDGEGACVECVDTSDCAGGEICLQEQCVPATCANGVLDGGESDVDCGGDCVPCPLGSDCHLPADCTSGFCDGGKCSPCADHDDCDETVTASYCDATVGDGTCVAQKLAGDVCQSAAECLDGACPADDGVCCATDCTGTCQACLIAKTGSPNGSCALVDPALEPDPDDECADEGAASCGANGVGCSGTSPSCTLYPQGSICSPLACIGSSLENANTCNGSGSCLSGATTSCAPYQCNDNGLSCRSFCTEGAHCLGTHYCSLTNACLPKKPNGAACADDAQCQDELCVDGICCSSPCAAGCVACSQAKTGVADGTCAFIASGQDPDHECAGQEVCDGSGGCSCAAGSTKPSGACCNSAAECASGHCAGGICCNAACSGTCESCLGAETGGANGACGYVSALTDPGNDCPGEQLCNGAGACWSCGGTTSPPGGSCPSVCTGGCNLGGTHCIIDCLGSSACEAQAVVCPPGFSCTVLCGFKGCKDAAIHCPALHGCEVSCQGAQSCKDSTVTCSSGVCELSCGSAGSACDGAELACGDNACSASCAGSTLPTVLCGSACSCSAC
jgi:hypothetical protein